MSAIPLTSRQKITLQLNAAVEEAARALPHCGGYGEATRSIEGVEITCRVRDVPSFGQFRIYWCVGSLKHSINRYALERWLERVATEKQA